MKMETLSWTFPCRSNTPIYYTYSVRLIKYMRSNSLSLSLTWGHFWHTCFYILCFGNEILQLPWQWDLEFSCLRVQHKMVHPRTISPGPVAVVDQTLLLTVCWTSFESTETFCNREQTVHSLHVVNEKGKSVADKVGPQEGATAGKLALFKSLQLTWGNLANFMSLFIFNLCFGLLSLPPALSSCCYFIFTFH